MIDKIKTILTIILSVIFIIGVIYIVVTLVSNAFKEPDLISIEEIALYKTNDNLIKDYHGYYYIESCLNNLIEGCKKLKYEELYELYMADYKQLYEKQEIFEMLKKYEKAENVKLKNAYRTKYGNILQVQLDNSEQYLLMNTENLKKATYLFAFIK